jgi:hypothetical protein
MTERGERVSLDQLFSEWEQRQPELDRARYWWLRDLALALFVSGGIYVVMRVFGFISPYAMLVSAILAVLLLRRALVAVPVSEPPPAMYSAAWGVLDDDGTPFAPIDGLVRAVQRWESRFGWTERDHVRYASAVRPRLVELVDERLRQRHGVTVRSDPQRARALVGEQLWAFLFGRVERTPSPREVAVMVGEMEKI